MSPEASQPSREKRRGADAIDVVIPVKEDRLSTRDRGRNAACCYLTVREERGVIQAVQAWP
jgi:hypothetical protein